MKKLQRKITAAADNDISEQLDSQLDRLKEDFDFILSGLERLGRSGANSSNDARAIAETLQNSLNNCIQNIADKVGE